MVDDRYPVALTRKVRRLASRGFSVAVIALACGLSALEVRAILPKPKPIKPVEVPKPIKVPKPVKPAGWRRTDARLDAAGWLAPAPLPATSATAELVDHQAVAEVVNPPGPVPPPATADGPGWGHYQLAFARGTSPGRSKLTQANVDEVRELRAAGWSTGKLAKRFGVARNTICYALNGTTWRES